MAPSKYLCFLLALVSAPVALSSPVHHESTPIAPLYIPPAPVEDLLNNSYIVMFKEDISPSAFSAHLSFASFLKEAVPLRAGDEVFDFQTDHVYDGAFAKGYAGRFSPDAVEMIRRRPEVDFVEQDQVEYADAKQEHSPWVIIFHGNFLPLVLTICLIS